MLTLLATFTWLCFYFAVIMTLQHFVSKAILCYVKRAKYAVIIRQITFILQWIITGVYLYLSYKFYISINYNAKMAVITSLTIMLTGYFSDEVKDTVRSLFIKLMTFSFLTIKHKNRIKKGLLYLRGFEHDDYASDYIQKKNNREDLFSEYLFTKAIKKIIPVFAIGMTKELTRPIGGKRIYLDDDTWQDDVKELMELAKYIFVHINATDSCLWEICETKKYLYKTFFLVDDIEKYNIVREKTNLNFPVLEKPHVPILITWSNGDFETVFCFTTVHSYSQIGVKIKYKEFEIKRQNGTLENDLINEVPNL